MERIAILSTPRSGNMWLRRLLRGMLDATELSVDTPAAIGWNELPQRLLLQLHWPPTDDLLARLRQHDFATVVLARHPADVLVSILQFAQTESRTARWLNGEGGNELSLVGADPCCEAFERYVLSERAGLLLGLTPRWWTSDGLDARVRYEDLTAEPERELTRVAGELGLDPGRVADVVAASTIDALRSETGSAHFWQGRPGLGRALMPAHLIERIALTHPDAFAVGGYATDGDAALSDVEALANWRSLAAGSASRTVTPPAVERLPLRLRLADESIEQLVQRVYALVLRRPADEAGLRASLDRIERNELSLATLLHELVTSPEGESVRRLADAIAFARWARRTGQRPRALSAPRIADETELAIPWLLARAVGPARLLDVGSAFAEPAYLAELLQLGATRLAAVDPAPVEVPGIELVHADVRQLPFRRGTFDTVLCAGTLQHVGADNRAYGLPAEHDANGAARALRELRRVLRGGGRLLVSVPTGTEDDLGVFVQRSPDNWLALFAEADFDVFEHELYELGENGWQSTVELTPDLHYGERGAGASALLCAELCAGRLRQQARRSLARLVPK